MSDPTRELIEALPVKDYATTRPTADGDYIGQWIDRDEVLAALSTTPAHSCDCDEHERTVGGLQSRLAEMEGAFNECMTRLAALSTTPAPDCARYFGSDGTLCATHNGRFMSDTTMRCDRSTP